MERKTQIVKGLDLDRTWSLYWEISASHKRTRIKKTNKGGKEERRVNGDGQKG